MALRQAGYSESGVAEVAAALALLVKHGVLGVALPPAPTPMPAAPLSATYFSLPQEPSAVFGPIGQVGLGMPPVFCYSADSASTM